MIKKLIVSFTLFITSVCPAFAIETAAKQAIMIDADTRSVLFEKNADEQMHPSSMSKLMTLYVAFLRLKQDRLKLDDLLPVSEKAWRMQGSKTFVKVGDKVPVEELLHGIIIQSGNDACIVIAEGLSGSEEAFVKTMDMISKEIGLKNSHFTNATGWPDDNHLMTARDLAILSQRIIVDFPEYYHYFAIPEHTYNNIKQYNRNLLLGGDLNVDGLKTGHTEVAGYGIALSAKQKDRRLILVINGLANEKQRKEEGDRLLRYGFREFENKKLVSKGQQVAEANVWFGMQDTVPLIAQTDAVVTMPIAASQNASFFLKYNTPLPAPIAQGAQVAHLVVRIPGQDDRVIPLAAGATVGKVYGFGHIKALFNHYVLNRSTAP